jgi:hypothetical protein
MQSMSPDKSILLPLTYLGPVQLYSRYFGNDTILIEQNDTYQKQTYRNRCDIYGANGKLSLIIPVKHERGKRLKVRDVKIDYDTDWRRLHWKGIVSAYNSSPYFEYYRDIFEPYFREEFIFLIDICMRLNEDVLKILGMPVKPLLTEKFIVSGEDEQITDLRSVILPKNSLDADNGFRIIEYNQVFMQTHGFIPGLSILDLIFNMGPESRSILAAGLKKNIQ